MKLFHQRKFKYSSDQKFESVYIDPLYVAAVILNDDNQFLLVVDGIKMILPFLEEVPHQKDIESVVAYIQEEK